MNEAFEKILDRLIIMRDKYSKDTTYDKNHISAYNKALKIVHEVAEEYKDKYVSKDEVGYMLDSIEMRGDETWMDYYRKALKGLCKLTDKEYKGGWISCSERLPEIPFGCFVTVEEDDRNVEPQNVLYSEPVGYDGETWNRADGEPIPFEVVAWMPLPEPYKAES